MEPAQAIDIVETAGAIETVNTIDTVEAVTATATQTALAVAAQIKTGKSESTNGGKGGKAIKASKAKRKANKLVEAHDAVLAVEADEFANAVKTLKLRKANKPRKEIKSVKAAETVKVAETVETAKVVKPAAKVKLNESLQAVEAKLAQVRNQLATISTQITQQTYKIGEYKTAIWLAANNSEPISPHETLLLCTLQREGALIKLKEALLNVKSALAEERAEVVAAAKSDAIAQDASDLKRILKAMQSKSVIRQKETPSKRKPKRKKRMHQSTHMRVVLAAEDQFMDL
ncbi:hypothetical protein HDU81_004765 [Chytriomyces hyalinus]|nr:hypothetical protein HDU81_004765 [Chytriomyces hyalinus]